MTASQVAFLVSRVHVKKIKSVLEEQNLLDRRTKITTEKSNANAGNEIRMVIPTTIPFPAVDLTQDETQDEKDVCTNHQKEDLLHNLGLSSLHAEITISSHLSDANSNAPTLRNPLLKALHDALGALPDSLLSSLHLTPTVLVSLFPESYSVYKPLLLLPSHAFLSAPWMTLLSSYPTSSPALSSVWNRLAHAVGATHIAINAGIPPKISSTSLSEDNSRENILRSPTNLTPIYGDFGPLPTAETLCSPTQQDFDSALWVSTSQNGIHQVWAPLYTMFSRGNMREKTRLLALPCVQSSISGIRKANTANPANGFEQGCTAVDLYAGIGYFAFSYKRAGVSKILCWELNPWSIEGLRRGAERNGWTTQIVTDLPRLGEAAESALRDVDFCIFRQSNEEAVGPISQLAWIPPIRHVNCGFLPSSRRSWPTAIRILDSGTGGWIHAHENVGVNEIEERQGEVVRELQNLLHHWEAEKGSYRRGVRCEHVERVKTYAPGVVHVVFDIWVDGKRDAEDLLP